MCIRDSTGCCLTKSVSVGSLAEAISRPRERPERLTDLDRHWRALEDADTLQGDPGCCRERPRTP
eukprot:3328246-Alexandrium_andersonii.AAC.1